MKNESYLMFLNGKLYGRGDLCYMVELFTNYVHTCKLYGKKEVTFTVREYDKNNKVGRLW